MNHRRSIPVAALGLMGLAGCGDGNRAPARSAVAVLDLDDVAANPDDYEWFEFRPNVMKLILAGAEHTEHIAILWYTVPDGSVGLHYHSKTESVYVIDGAQTDDKGTYSNGTVYFNPPGSGHAISKSSGFFLLAYAAPPDFAATDSIQEYTPVRIDTDDDALTDTYSFDDVQAGVRVSSLPLEDEGGMRAAIIETTSSEPYTYSGNYVLVLAGRCRIDGETHAESVLVVGKDVAPRDYAIAAPVGESCLALAVSFDSR
ncbi:MAG TPA: cupin domain-containing protein [Polyangiaceae bacterium]|nr:cupin domain-containing protein [Polyangiaceae bacterium]